MRPANFAVLTLVVTITLAALLNAAHANFRSYPGFLDPHGTVEMVHDKGLMLELHVRCSRRADGRIQAGIMTYSKVERLFCSSRLRCFRDPVRAVEDTCG